MIIQQCKNSTLAFAPDNIANVINKHTEHKSLVYCGDIVVDADIVHFHNCIKNPKGKLSILQFHSEPKSLMKKFMKNPFIKKQLVISQYHATLPEYSHCTIVRNPIDFIDNIGYNLVTVDDKIRIGYSPSTIIKHSVWADKGYNETLRILNLILEAYPNKVELDIIIGVKLGECIRRKSLCNIIIDECVTTSFHRSGLEGLALGKMTICSVGDAVIKVMKKASGSNTVPFENVSIEELEMFLRHLIEKRNINFILRRGKENRTWMEKYWHPKVIANEYIKIYKEVLEVDNK